jgi:hypothetical protein
MFIKKANMKDERSLDSILKINKLAFQVSISKVNLHNTLHNNVHFCSNKSMLNEKQFMKTAFS